MATIHFTSNLRRHVDCPSVTCSGRTVREALEEAFAQNQRLKTYVLDDEGELRKHMSILLNGKAIADRARQSDRVAASDEIWVMQALSGG